MERPRPTSRFTAARDAHFKIGGLVSIDVHYEDGPVSAQRIRRRVERDLGETPNAIEPLIGESDAVLSQLRGQHFTVMFAFNAAHLEDVGEIGAEKNSSGI